MGDTIVISPTADEPCNMYKADSGALTFRVHSRTGHAKLSLLDKNYPYQEMYKIILGQVTRIMHKQDSTAPGYNTANILVPGAFTEFWLTWYGKFIRIGLVGQAEPIASRIKNSTHEVIGFVVFTKTSVINTVEWVFEAPPVLLKSISKQVTRGQVRWVPLTDRLPFDALIGGFEGERPTFIARAHHNGSLCPGKYVPSLDLAFVAWGGLEHQKRVCEILCGYNAEWVWTRENAIPENAVIGGYSEVRRESLYIGRAQYMDQLIVGKVHGSYKTCYFPYDGKEREESHKYQILVSKEREPRAITIQDGEDRLCS